MTAFTLWLVLHEQHWLLVLLSWTTLKIEEKPQEQFLRWRCSLAIVLWEEQAIWCTTLHHFHNGFTPAVDYYYFFYHYHYRGCTNFTTDALQLEMKTEHLRLSLLLENYPLERDWIGWENIYLHLHIEDPAHLIPQPFVFAIKPSILLQMVTVQLIGLFSAQ